ncbi:hypothetical protein HZ996_06530 [Cryomorphaceae bacterium]|nr:hypothetical protein HZ996_06530 [Cryomorphaceae bacterium]
MNYKSLLLTVFFFFSAYGTMAQYVESFSDGQLKRLFSSTGTDSITKIDEGRFILYYGAVAVNLYNDLAGDLMLAWAMEGRCSDDLIHRWNAVRLTKAYIDDEDDVVLSTYLRAGCLQADDVLRWQSAFVDDQKLFVDLVLEDRLLNQTEE